MTVSTDRSGKQLVPLGLAFVLCYVAAHLALDLLDEQQAEEILIYCEEQFEEE